MFSAAKKPAPSNGTELMLRSLGLGEVIEAAKTFANAGTMQKIVKFSEEVGEINGRLETIERLLRTIVASSDAGNGGLVDFEGDPPCSLERNDAD